MLNVHDILINELKKIPDDKVAVCLSSGVDSRSILYGLLEIGKKPTVYSFTLANRQSKDFLVARQLAKKYNLKFVPVYLPVDKETLIADVIKLHNEYGCVKKTEYICTFPFLYLYPKIDEKYIVDGLYTDGHFCLSKKGMIHYKNNIDAYRRIYWSKENGCQIKQHTMLCKKYDKIKMSPYKADKMINYFMGSTWEEVNKPKQKQPILNAFPEQFGSEKVYLHTNFQLGDSGISELFNCLVNSRLNKNNSKSVVGVFNQVNRGNY